MQFQQLKSQLKDIGLMTVRVDADNYFEAVLVKDKLKELSHKLEIYFGFPVWPSKDKLSLQIEEAISKFGGVTAGQTLYFHHRDSDVAFAMLWPWNDGEHITLKIIQK